jgi:hypothetical protein
MVCKYLGGKRVESFNRKTHAEPGASENDFAERYSTVKSFVYQSSGGKLFIQIANIYSSLLFHPRPIMKAAAATQLFLYFHLEEIFN